MPTQILMPQLSPTMEEGKLAKWHVKEGDAVRSGDVVAEVETDKATMEVEAAEDGVIEKILLAEGTEHVPVNHPIALLRLEDEAPAAAATKPDAAAQTAPARPEPSPAPAEAAIAVHASPVGDATPEAVLDRIAEQIRRNGRNGRDGGGERIFASPLARRLACEFGLELGELEGSGPRGRIVRADVERAARKATARPEPEAATPEPRPAEPAREPRLQELVARHEAPEPRGLSDSQVLALYRPDSYEIIPHDTMRK
ncbi:MAG: biotin/lipoyl-containing protein, partial [Methyloceanibacter sp.]